jgi:ferredoxin
MSASLLEKALLPYEKKLQAQERLRKSLGVKEVERPTYERYITGPIERFDRRRSSFQALEPDNPYGEEFRKEFKARTGHDNFTESLPYSELEKDERIDQSLRIAGTRPCREYNPEPLPVTPAAGRTEVKDLAWMSRLIKKVGLMWGADIVRITRLDPRWVYEGLDISHPYAIVVAVHHLPSFINTAPSHLSGFSTGNAYSRLKFITTQLTDFIRGLGYDAAYRETLHWNPEILMVPLAIDAGIGEFGRTGRVLSPEFGINIRLKAVTTDLPLAVDKPISFGVHEFCMACENCATYCPANAVPFGPPTDKLPSPIFHNPGFKKWFIRADRCLTFFASNKKKWNTCGGRCIVVCPWNKPMNAFHNLVRWTAIHSPAGIQKMLAWGDRQAYHRKKRIRA